MRADKLSARQAALIAQARAQLGKTPVQAPATAQVARVKRSLPAAPVENAAGEAPTPASARSPAERLDALMGAARAESQRRRERQRRLYVWVPLAFFSVAGLWTLLWLWNRL